MLDITSKTGFLRVIKQMRYDTNNDVQVVVELAPGDKIDSTVTRVDEMWSWYSQQQYEEQLRRDNPALQDAWEKYQVIKTLVTKTNGT
jgi:hypothetical protein